MDAGSRTSLGFLNKVCKCLSLFCCEMDPLMEPVAGGEDEMLSEPCAYPVVKAVTIPSLS